MEQASMPSAPGETSDAYDDLVRALTETFLTEEAARDLRLRQKPALEVLRSARAAYDAQLQNKWMSSLGGRWVRSEVKNLFTAWIRLGDLVSMTMVKGEYESALTRLILPFLKKDGIFIDIGANVGWYTLNAAASYKALGGGCVFAFEPQPDIYAHL